MWLTGEFHPVWKEGRGGGGRGVGGGERFLGMRQIVDRVVQTEIVER